MENIIEKLAWRYACKQFDPAKKLSDSQVSTLLESLRLSASSFGLQPWSFVVVRNPKIREELVGHSWKQRQVSEASHLFVLCQKKDMTAAHVDAYLDDLCRTRGVSRESMKGYEDMMKGFLTAQSPEKKAIWMKDQVYIALGTLLTVCATEQIDSCPMEGFDKVAYDRILNLDAWGLTSVVVIPVGFRSSQDKYASLKKVRFPKEKLVHYID